MSISALDNENGECDELIAHLRQQRRDENRICRKALKKHRKQWRSEWHNGYAAYIGGFRPDEGAESYYEHQPEMLEGYNAAKQEQHHD